MTYESRLFLKTCKDTFRCTNCFDCVGRKYHVFPVTSFSKLGPVDSFFLIIDLQWIDIKAYDVPVLKLLVGE